MFHVTYRFRPDYRKTLIPIGLWVFKQALGTYAAVYIAVTPPVTITSLR